MLAWCPARQVELPAFAIATLPVTNALYRQFMAEAGESQQPGSWWRDVKNREDDRAAAGLSWWQAIAFAEWAGCRLPFEHEWERAVRGVERRIYPWGSSYETAKQIWESYYPTTLSVTSSRTPEGLLGVVCGQAEWCADYWSEPSGVDALQWEEETEPAWTRVRRGGDNVSQTLPSAVSRASSKVLAMTEDTAQLRLVRADGRSIPPPHPTTPPDTLARGALRAFESKILVATVRQAR